jgi:hypothetical protein
MTPYGSLCAAIRNPRSTSQQLGDALRAYFAWGKPKRKPLGSGDLLVVETTGKMSMMTREAYADLVYKRKKKSSRITVDGKTKYELKLEAREAEPVRKRKPKVILPDQDVLWIDDFATRQQEELDKNAYYGEW